jgi:AraC-like DNA-binding protein
MEGVIDLLQSTRLAGGVFLDAEFTAPWCVFSGVTAEEVAPFVTAPTHIISYHYICAGSMVLELDGHAPVTVESGEVVLLPHNEAHRLGSAPGLQPVNAEQFLQPGEGGAVARIVHGGGGVKTRMLCGFLASEIPDVPVLRVLPRVLKVHIADAPSSAWIESTMRFGAQEIAGGVSGSPAVLGKLAELLFVEAVRRYIATQPEEQSTWRAGVGDPMVGRALALLHRKLSQPWTAADLAREVGLSRSAFADRFTRIMGETPMRYLAQQRLQAAARRLATSADPITRIAFEVGYDSEAAFNRAFKRAFGAPPATWRAERAQAGG